MIISKRILITIANISFFVLALAISVVAFVETEGLLPALIMFCVSMFLAYYMANANSRSLSRLEVERAGRLQSEKDARPPKKPRNGGFPLKDWEKEQEVGNYGALGDWRDNDDEYSASHLGINEEEEESCSN